MIITLIIFLSLFIWAMVKVYKIFNDEEDPKAIAVLFKEELKSYAVFEDDPTLVLESLDKIRDASLKLVVFDTSAPNRQLQKTLLSDIDNELKKIEAYIKRFK